MRRVLIISVLIALTASCTDDTPVAVPEPPREFGRFVIDSLGVELVVKEHLVCPDTCAVVCCTIEYHFEIRPGTIYTIGFNAQVPGVGAVMQCIDYVQSLPIDTLFSMRGELPFRNTTFEGYNYVTFEYLIAGEFWEVTGDSTLTNHNYGDFEKRGYVVVPVSR